MKRLKWTLLVILVVAGHVATAVDDTTTATTTQAPATGSSPPSSVTSPSSTVAATQPTSAITTEASTTAAPSSTIPATAAPIVCLKPNITNGQVDTSGAYHVGSNVSFSCNTGYKLNGASHLTCLSNGTWNGNKPICDKIQCTPPTGFVHGSWAPMQATYNYSDTVTLTCNKGFAPSQPVISSCNDTKTWIPAPHTCSIKQCTPPVGINNGRYIPNNATYVYNNSVTYSCNTGFELDPEGAVSTCTDTNIWTPGAPTCQRKKCTPPADINNGRFIPNKATYVYNDTVAYSCNAGYELNHETASSTCTDTNTWTPGAPTCQRKKCTPPADINNGRFIPIKATYVYNDTVAYSCNAGYELNHETASSTCTDTNTWTPGAPTCQRKKCPLLTAPQHGTIDPADKEDYWVNTTVTYSCDPGYRLDGSATAVCTESKQWSPPDTPTCTLKLDYNQTCDATVGGDQCSTKNATCRAAGDGENPGSRCLCSDQDFYLVTNNTCKKKIFYATACNELWPDDQCQTDNAQCLKLDDQNTWKCQCNYTFFHYNDTICVKRLDYNIAALKLQIQSNKTTETTATLSWQLDVSTQIDPFTYFLVVIQNQTGDEVKRFNIYYNMDPDVPKKREIEDLEPGHHYSAVIIVYLRGIPSIQNVTLNYCTRPLGVNSLILENVEKNSLNITWDYEPSNVFSNFAVALTSTQNIPDDAFVNCPDQQNGVCTLTRNDTVKYLHVHNLTPGTQYNVSIYTSACDSGPHSVKNKTSSYTVPSLPVFTVEDSEEGITASSVTVKWGDKDVIKSVQFQEWHAVVKNTSSTFIKNETFQNDVFEGTIKGLSSATSYTIEFYTTVPGQQSSTSTPVQFYTRPKDVAAATVNAVHETNLTVSIPGPADNSDVFFRVLVTSTDGHHDERNVTGDSRSVTMTGLTAATHYNITVYAVVKKSDGTLLASTNAFVTWSYSGPPPPDHVTIDSIEGDTLSFTPSVNITQKVKYEVSYEAMTDPSSSGHKEYDSGQIKLVNLTMGTRYRILIYTNLIQTPEPNVIKSDRFYKLLTYTRPPAVAAASIHVSSTTNDSLTIQWSAPSVGDVSNYTYNGTFTCTSPNDNRVTSTQSVLPTNQSTATATELDPGSNCSVDILTLVGGLVSDSSYTTLTQNTNESAPEQVRGLQVSSEAASSIAVVWKYPSIRNGVIRSYEIRIPRYKPDICEPGNPFGETGIECYRTILFDCSDCASDGQISPTTPPHKGVPACGDSEAGGSFSKGQADFSHTIAGLHAYMNYSIEIAAYTLTRGKSDMGTSVTTESTPGAPMGVHGDPDSSSSLTLSWNPPVCGKRNGVLGDYTITYKYRNDTVCVDQSGAGEITKHVSGINRDTHTLSNLKAFWNYSLSVVASTSMGNGESSSVIPVETFEDAPGIVRGITVSSETAASLQLTWTQPCFPNGILTNYTIELNNTDKGGNVLTYSSDTAISKNVTGLLSYRNYTVTIWGHTAGHTGHKAEPIRQRTSEGVPHAPIGVVGDATSDSKVEVSWNNSIYTGPTSYVAFVANQPHLKCETGIDFMNSSCTIGGLLPFTEYAFIVTATTKAGSTNSEKSEKVTTEEAVPGVVTSVGVTPEGDVTKERSITVAWAPPKRGDRHGTITGYVINIVTAGVDVNCTTDASNQETATCPTSLGISCTTNQTKSDSTWTCELTNIATGEYNVTVFAKTSVGAGPPTQTPATVDPGAPLSIAGAAGAPSLVKPGGTSVGDPKRQISVQFPRNVICNDVNGPPSSWGIVVAEESLATDTPFTGTLADFNTARISGTYKTWFQVEGSENMAPYIATTKTWNPCQAQKGARRKRSASSGNVAFVVGQSGKCSGAPSGERCNGELEPDKSYRVKAYACTDGGCTETKYSAPITTEKLFPVAIVAGVASAVVVLTIVVVVVVFMKRRQMVCFGKSVDEESSTHRSEPPVSSSEMRNISVTHNSHVFKPGAVKLVDFPVYVDRLHRDSNMLFSDGYKMIKEECAQHLMTAAESQRNRPKNRYTNILAYDHSRVKLLPVDDDDDSDYINANYIPGYTSKREYIACQGALVATFNDFWRMVWEQNVDTIVMLTKLVEKGRHKCDKYWPELNEPVYFGDLVVCVQSESHLSDYTIRVMEVKLKDTRRLVRQFCYLRWPDMGCPDQPSQLIEFVKSVKEYTNANSTKKGPMIVHCSAGVGRTGTFIAVDYLLQYIRDHDDIDIYKLVLEMRNYRCNMVQTEDQYVYIHECMKEFITVDSDEDEEDEEPLYMNTPTNSGNVYENTAFNADM